MSDQDEALSVGELSDLSGASEGETEIAMGRNPPTRGYLEKESSKLRSKYKIMREALIDERLADLDQRIGEIERDANPTISQELKRLEGRRREKLKASHERKRVKIEAILNEYQAKVQEVEDTRTALDQEMASKASASHKGSSRKQKHKAPPADLNEDLKEIRKGVAAVEESKLIEKGSNFDCVHSE